ncbi:hypothetical protein GEU84_005610 [Fertoebacter nigrum]|uniref:Uncharacterized protein n=1 Tax=Fertoeibacter niger TaxID=2656921 RepID=A0A8X8KNJ2_9RHOB|nr:hypothetical protein [Fertoeibacter niger]NUB43851.1 hypothetical protein [Fertoeibacter niger]
MQGPLPFSGRNTTPADSKAVRIAAMGRAKELGQSPAQMESALLSVNFGGGDNLA